MMKKYSQENSVKPHKPPTLGRSGKGSSQRNLTLVFLYLTLLTVLLSGIVVFFNWYASTQAMIIRMSEAMNSAMLSQVDEFLSLPQQANAQVRALLESGLVDLEDPEARDKLFTGQLQAQASDIYSFSLGTADGEYYGTRRNAAGELEIMRNNAETGGASWYYAVSPDQTAGQKVHETGPFDARTRDWYKAAVAAGQPVFSPIYKHFVMDDLTLSAATPIFSPDGALQGVLGSHFILSQANQILSETAGEADAIALVVEAQTGRIVLNSLGLQSFKRLPDEKLERLTLADLDKPALEAVFTAYGQVGTQESNIELSSIRYAATVQPYQRAGIDWVLITAIPESRFTDGIFHSMRVTAAFVLLAVLAAILIFRRFSFRVIRLLQTNQDHLQLILDSAAEAIYGIDLDGRCTFVNASCLKILGYADPAELIGKNAHDLIHHSNRHGQPMPIEDCQVSQALREGHGTHVDNEDFWRADGTHFDVEYHSYPQFSEGQLTGAVVTFTDTTERKAAREKIEYLSLHDSLTGLYNRAFFDAEFSRLDTARNLPLAVIVGDVNGLKLTNDVFGHRAGDQLLAQTAAILSKVCRSDEIIARTGGDEFMILLPRTSLQAARTIMQRLDSELAQSREMPIPGSISLGAAVKTEVHQSLTDVLDEAERLMYQRKTVDRRKVQTGILYTLVADFQRRYPGEKAHAERVRRLTLHIASRLKLAPELIRTAKEAALLHDVGKMTLDPSLLDSGQPLTDEALHEWRQHPVVGYRLLNACETTCDLADLVLAHHEAWDGSGFPKGLAGSEIPLIARIITVATSYDRLLQGVGPAGSDDPAPDPRQALETLRQSAGSRFDPAIVQALADVVECN
jgi:diguanylate cyclase (GGDEF)-like protein/PAS domain S-box-containing protein